MEDPEEIKESIREFLYDLERAKTDDEIHDLIMHYAKEWPMACEREWKKNRPTIQTSD